MMEIISRAEAIDRGLKRYFTGKPCKHGHVSERLVSIRACLRCQKLEKRTRRRTPQGAQVHREEVRRYNKTPSGQRRIRSYNTGVGADRGRFREKDVRLRRASWADRRSIRAIYESARRVSACIGIQFVVDHIIPLKGRRVSGLHVQDNLQVLPARANLRKGNAF